MGLEDTVHEVRGQPYIVTIVQMSIDLFVGEVLSNDRILLHDFDE